jgi:hypothetical protein
MIQRRRIVANRAPPLPSAEELAAFLTEARLATGQRKVMDICWVERRKRTYSPPASTLHYTSRSLGHKRTTGNELIELHDTPIWASNTLGGITRLFFHLELLELTVIQAFLQGRFLHRSDTGPKQKEGYRFDGFRYVYREHGTLADGYGEEELFYGAYLVYQTHFRHGFLR